MSIFVGCCDYAGLSLKEYSENFEVIETQSTFYKLPSATRAENWRQQVKMNFMFTVRAFQGITHPMSSPAWRKAGSQKPVEKIENYGHLKPREQNFECWANTIKICKALDSKVCVVQLPLSFICNEENSRNITEFFKNVERSFTVTIEFRHRSWDDDQELPEELLKKYRSHTCCRPSHKEALSKEQNRLPSSARFRQRAQLWVSVQ